MSYRSCPHCRSSNRASDTTCYNCEKPLDAVAAPAACRDESLSSKETVTRGELKDVGQSFVQAIVPIGLVSAFGAALSVVWESFDLDLPFFLETVSLGVLCALATVFLVGKFRDMPVGLLYNRLLPAAIYGAIVGSCLYGIWYSFDPYSTPLAIGGFAGILTAAPVVTSFGLFGGESRPMGSSEFLNLIIGLGLGAVVGLFICLDSEDYDMFLGLTGLIGVLPALFGGRLNLWEVVSYFNTDSSSARSRW